MQTALPVISAWLWTGPQAAAAYYSYTLDFEAGIKMEWWWWRWWWGDYGVEGRRSEVCM